MSFGDYLFGVIGLALVAIPIALAATRLRARLLPGWGGAPARLAEAVLGVSVLTVLLQALGAIGILAPGVLIAAALAIGLAIHLGPWLRTDGASDAEPPPAPPIPVIQTLVALAAATFVAAHWATGLQDVWARGMLTFDTLWYHGPFAARIAEEGSVWGMHFTDPLYLNWFYPDNSELHHGAGIVLFDRDVFSPLINFGWLGITFLAAWCIGRPYRVAPLSLAAVAIVMDTGPMVPREAGTPATDTAPVALLLAAAAILITYWASRPRESREPGGGLTGALLVAGLAIGTAVGTKLTVSGAAAAMAAAIPFIVPPGLRRRAFLVFLGGVAAVAGFWFLRNLIHSGNPLPWVREIGPIELPGPNRGLEGRDDYTVAHYIFENPSTAIWSSFFLTALENLFGPLWFLILGGAAGGGALAVWRPRSPAVRLAGVVTIAAAVAYLFTPLTAAGPEGQPLAFGINLRYLAPGLALGLALLPLEPRLTPERLRLPLLVGGLAALMLTSFYSDADVAWDGDFASVPWALLIGIVLIGAPIGLALVARRSAVLAGVAGGVLAVAIAGAGWERQDDYLENRYTRADDFRFQLDDAVRWAKPTSELRIAVAGTSGAYNQYGFYGDDLSNHVQYVGRHLPQADFRAIESCRDFREAVNEGDYDYLVTTPKLDLNDPATATPSPERGWVAEDPAVERILDAGRTSVYRITGDLTPERCANGADRRKSGAEAGGSATADQ
ncbi:MAG TPA: hypothetical protein VFL56_02100 [Solirubrobacterales bacterium]|nr:hypothetical protein [Solirubrobacterales bacterium]